MLTFVENSAFRIGRGFGYCFIFVSLCSAVLFIVIKRLLSVLLTIGIDLFHELFFVFFCSLRYRLFYCLMHICICFNMCTVYEYCIRCQIAVLFYLVQNPFKHLVNRFFVETMLEVIADGREMR